MYERTPIYLPLTPQVPPPLSNGKETLAPFNVLLQHLSLSFSQPGGSLVLTTINRTALSYAAAIVGAEYILRIVKPGTHDWNKFVTVEELSELMSESKLY